MNKIFSLFMAFLLLSSCLSLDPCGSSNHMNSTDCTKENSLTEYCCLFISLDNATSFCNKIAPPTYLPSMTTYKLEDTEYKIQCDIKEGTPGSPCGVLHPTSVDNCRTSSTSSNSCCFYSNMNMHYCFWTGFFAPEGPLLANVTC